jgi:excisionase family DNA binding protein
MSTTFLTIQQTAEKLSVSPSTVRRWIKQGHLPAIKIGRTVRILEKEMTRLSHTRGHQTEPTIDVAAASDEVFFKTWDNDADAVYDNWREIYGVPER